MVLLGTNVLCGSEPEEHITATTIYANTDFLLDQLRWQYAAFLEDRLDVQGFADTLRTEPAQILRLDEDRAGMLMPWLDEMVAAPSRDALLSENGGKSGEADGAADEEFEGA